MKKIFILILSVLTINTAFAQSFSTTAEIINSDCRIQFNNSNGTKIFELIGENLTWWRQSNNSIVIRDKVTQVTIASNYSGTPAFSALDDSLDAWILACKDCCSGGSSGGGSDTIILDGNAFIVQGQNSAIQVDNTIDYEGDEIQFTGISTTENNLDILIGVASGLAPDDVAIAQVNNDSGFVRILAVSDFGDGKPAMSIDVENTQTEYSMIFEHTGIGIIGANLPKYPLAIGNPGTGLFLLGNTGNIEQEGSYSNTAIEINSAGGNDTIPSNTFTYLYNPASLQATATITLPLTPIDGQILHLVFGGTITSGAVVTTLTLAAGAFGINAGTVSGLGAVESPLTFQFIAEGINKWFLLSK